MAELHLGANYNGQANNLIYTQGTQVDFYGTYIPNTLVNIYLDGIVRTHITQAQVDSTGYFSISATLPDVSPGETYTIRACSAGGLWIYECSLFPDVSVEAIALIVSNAGGGGTGCLREGEFNFPYLGKDCCPGLETGWDLRCTPIRGDGGGGGGGCIPSWKCEVPANGYESDGCGLRRLNPACKPVGGCTPSWKCETPLNGYKSDGCGNRQLDVACNPGGGGGTGAGLTDNQMLAIGVAVGFGLLAAYLLTRKAEE